MLELTSITAVERFINDHRFSFIYISRANCGVCHALMPQVKHLLEEFPVIRLGHVNADEVEEIAGRFLVLTVPALLLFVEGKEMIREARFVPMESLQKRISKIYTFVEAKPE